jgi:hypothetical protein
MLNINKFNFYFKIILLIFIFISLGFLLFLFLDTNLTKKNYEEIKEIKVIKENYNDNNEDDFYLSNMRTRDYQDVISITESQVIDTNFLEKIFKKKEDIKKKKY